VLLRLSPERHWAPRDRPSRYDGRDGDASLSSTRPALDTYNHPAYRVKPIAGEVAKRKGAQYTD